MIGAILEELDGVIAFHDIVVLVATGSHRANTEEEIRAMLGDEIANAVRVVNHDARDESGLVWRGTLGAGVPVWLNREWVEADFRITTGFVEPHFFAGFSGGPKMVAPGLAGLETVLTLHDARRIGDPDATFGVCIGNPVHDDVRAIALKSRVGFGLDVVLNRDHEIAGVFGGDLFEEHEAARQASAAASMCKVPRRAAVVLTSNAGYPLDQNLYQAVKGMSAASKVVERGGLIVCAAECRDGFPDHGGYRELLASQPTPEALLADITRRSQTVPDQWQVQIQAKIQSVARVAVHSSYLDAADLRAAHLEVADDITATIEAALDKAGPDSYVCVLPLGPETIPFVA